MNQLRRDLLNNPRIYQDVLDTVGAGMSPCIMVSHRHNAIYGTEDFHRSMAGACAHGRQVAGCTRSSKRIGGADGDSRPSDEWMRDAASRTRGSNVYKCFAKTVVLQLDQMRKMRLLKKDQEIDLAIDMHLIPRYDKSYGAELVRSKAKDGTHVFERYITIQSTVQNLRLVLGVLNMPSLEDTADFVRKIIGSARDVGACIGMAMLDREFFTADVMGTLGDMGIKYLIPCKNTDTVVDAIAEFATGRRGRVSKSVIVGGDGREVSYTMTITERKKRKKRKDDDELLPHEKYIGFVTNVPDVDPDSYGNRWGIETGYRMIENTRAKTHSKNPMARLLCFVYSVAVFNAWVMANATLMHVTGIYPTDPPITQQDLRDMLLLLIVFGYKEPPEPPPPVLP